jgi:hypothetical protein
MSTSNAFRIVLLAVVASTVIVLAGLLITGQVREIAWNHPGGQAEYFRVLVDGADVQAIISSPTAGEWHARLVVPHGAHLIGVQACYLAMPWHCSDVLEMDVEMTFNTRRWRWELQPASRNRRRDVRATGQRS